MTIKRILFLDIDGVLNSSEWFHSEEYARRKAARGKRSPILDPKDPTLAEELWQTHIDPTPLALLQALVAELELTVVLSSTWRTLTAGIAALKKAGFEFLSFTPILGVPRGREIQKWIDLNEYRGPFVILDDDMDMEHLMPRLVLCNPVTGFTATQAAKLRSLLR